MRIGDFFTKVATIIVATMISGAAWAQDGINGLESIGKPVSGGIGFQTAATELARDIQWLDGMVNWIIGIICLFVTALLIWVIVFYNRRANKDAARFTHHSTIEVIWTVAPILILIVIGSFSLPILFKQLEIPESDLTIKVTGNQWYWTYEYPDSEFEFDSYMIGTGEAGLTEAVKAELAEYGYAEDEYMLATDNAVVVPVNAVVRLQITGGDVIHAWAIPSFGVKLDAVPGRLNETWFAAETEGVYFGQCSELCGKDHTYMPITVKVVSQDMYDAWLNRAIEEFAGLPTSITVASAD
ncbi:cytochrome c oxidase subunit II [Rhodobacterales bacterium 52_120_T64]|nr:cytochrome c oxidase subunit II [Rhodobacterales bacterium 52_120_T64]